MKCEVKYSFLFQFSHNNLTDNQNQMDGYFEAGIGSVTKSVNQMPLET